MHNAPREGGDLEDAERLGRRKPPRVGWISRWEDVTAPVKSRLRFIVPTVISGGCRWVIGTVCFLSGKAKERQTEEDETRNGGSAGGAREYRRWLVIRGVSAGADSARNCYRLGSVVCLSRECLCASSAARTRAALER